MTFPTLWAGNKTADVHSLAVVILGNSKAGAATARDDEHAKFLLVHRVVEHTSNEWQLSAKSDHYLAFSPSQQSWEDLAVLFLTADG
ncbi:MAG TPA: hypothetical protein VNU74_07375 [Terriglobales bacterium]|nr:hypothetical protein [Terriglobales bacterium]